MGRDNPTLPPVVVESSIPDRFCEVVRCGPNRLAVMDGEEYITYAELDAWSERIAQAISSEVGDHPQPIALHFSQGIPAIAAMLGVLKAGHFYAVLDTAMPTHRVQAVLSNLCTPYLLTNSRESGEFPGMRVLDCPGRSAQPVAGIKFPVLLPDALAAIYYTSGTTGQPKGVMIDHRMILHRIYQSAQEYPVISRDTVAALFSPAFSSAVSDIYGALLHGATLAIYRPAQQSTTNLRDWLIASRVTVLHLHSGILGQLLAALPADFCFEDLRYVRPSGRTLVDEVRRLRRHLHPDAIVTHQLASSETWTVCRLVIRTDTQLEGEILPVGYPVRPDQVKLIGADGQPVQGEGIGEIVVRSPYLARGYWNQPELTAQRFQTDPEEPGYRIYRMGDRVQRRADGIFELLGRNDLQVKIRGYTVNLEAVETVLARLPSVQEAAVTAQTTRHDTVLVAYICVGANAADCSSTLLRRALGQELPAYMIPARFTFLEALPRHSNGKVDRASLPPPGRSRPDLDTPFGAPRSEVEQQIADIWAELLDLDEVGVEDNFFELGGDSILAMRMALAVEQTTGGHVPPEFFRAATVAHLANMIPNTTHSPVDLALHPVAHRGFGTRNRNSRRITPRRVLSHLTFTGPIWQGRALPYVMGVRLQRLWIRLPEIRQRLRGNAAPLLEWLTELGRDDQNGAELELSLLANTWRGWREACIQQPTTFARWVTVLGGDFLNTALATNRPIVLVGTHTAIRNQATRMAIGQCSARPVWTLGYTPTDVADAVAKVVYARDLLIKGGIVLVTGDGAQGGSGVELSIHGRPWLFRKGGAELALDAGATLIPLFTTLAHSGQITVEFLKPLTSTQPGRQQIEDLTSQYAALLTERWPNLLSNMKWGKLRQILDYQSVG